MTNKIIYGVIGLGAGAGLMWLAIRQGWIVSPVAPVVARARAPMQARARPVNRTNTNARQFNGRVTATNIPTQYARAGIGATQQGWGQHADLIRVD
ncbi:hypothetical protein ES703_118231 [subsurface metagenome]